MSLFITFEGIDGSGKSTIATKIYHTLQKQNIPAILTKEPTDTEIGLFVQNCIKKNTNPYVTAFSFIADRILHSKQITTWLNQKKIVICDRYAASTYAYQGAQLQQDMPEPMNWLQDLSKNLIQKPHITFLFDIDPEIALKRIQTRPELIPFEKKTFLTAVRHNYLILAEQHDFSILDASQSITTLYNKCLNTLKEKYHILK